MFENTFYRCSVQLLLVVMSELSNSSAIRACLNDESPESEIESDNGSGNEGDGDLGTDVDDYLSDQSLTDFSSGSGDLYIPNSDDEDSDTSITDFDNLRPRQNAAGPNIAGRHRPSSLVPDSDPDDPPLPDVNNAENRNEPLPGPRLSSGLHWVRVYPPEEMFDVTEKFQVRNTGARNLPPPNSPPIIYFYQFFTHVIWSLMVRETNAYANKQIEEATNAGTLTPNSRLRKWKETSIHEMKKFMALLINMGLNFKQNMENYWSSASSQRIPFFPDTMSLHRFQALRSMFHISSLRFIPKGELGHDPWYKVRHFYELMNGYFKVHFVPGQNISLDESMIGMKNRCSFIKYMPNKRHARFGIKKFEVCDSKTGYVVHSELYSGKTFLEGNPNVAFTQKVVMHLLTECHLLNKGYHLYTDNYYTKLPLAKELLEKDTYLTGTVNKRSKELSKNVLQAKLEPESSIYFRRQGTLLVGYKQKKKRKPVYLITTGYPADDRMIKSKKSGIEAIKPSLINEYNLHMGGVDSKDKSIYHSTCTRATKKYWKKIFENFLDMALLNSYILYLSNTDQPMKRYNFMVSIVESLVSDGTVPRAQVLRVGPGGDAAASGGAAHSLTRLPGVQLRVCVVCSKPQKKSRSHFWCPACNSGVHPACFHKLEHFWRAPRRGKRPRANDGSDSE